MKAKLIKDLEAAPSAPESADGLVERDGVRWWIAGTVMDDPRAYRLVQMGVAEPADEECKQAAGNMTERQLKLAQRQQEMVSKGIHPDDYQRFLNGEITGYDEDGNDIPGPNYIEQDEE